ncbi:MAG: hypothetical protein VYD54_03575 [Bdellovibrionota bacterium]|nr:hypothetical protein [Bdellovibrionota bacterium]
MNFNNEELDNMEKIFMIMKEKVDTIQQWETTNDTLLLQNSQDLAKKYSPQEIRRAFSELEDESQLFPDLSSIVEKIESGKKSRPSKAPQKKSSPKSKMSDTEKIFDLLVDRRTRFRNWRRDATMEACADFAQWLGQDYTYNEVKEGLDIVCKEQTYFPSYDIIFKAISRYIARNVKERENRIYKEAKDESGDCDFCSNKGHLVMWKKGESFHMIFKCSCKRGSLFPNYQSILAIEPAHWQLKDGDQRTDLRDFLAQKNQFIQNGKVHTLS